jgi:hypothetical protein
METPNYPCPCCGNFTLSDEPPGTFLCCDVCWWEDDPVQFADPSYRGGANVPSLTEAREYFKAIQVSNPDLKHLARPPRPEELPEHNSL